MTKRRTKEERQAPLFWGLTPNQLVGYNLWCARQERGWTQAQAAEALEPHLGVRWTVAQVSAAERSVDGTRVRQFTADDLVAFAQAFDVPITYFFIPPRPSATWSKVKPGTSEDALNRTMAVMIDLILGDGNEGAPLMAKHLSEVMRDLDPALFSDAQERIFALARLRVLGVVGSCRRQHRRVAAVAARPGRRAGRTGGRRRRHARSVASGCDGEGLHQPCRRRCEGLITNPSGPVKGGVSRPVGPERSGGP